jgi:hypothetical protein
MWKRVLVWLIEVWAEALLLALIMMTKLAHDSYEHASIRDVLIFSVAIMYMFFFTGYLLTTALFRFLWKVQTIWSYPMIAVLLFSAHFEILNLGMGGAFDPKDRLIVRIAGACITFSCTYFGSYVLQQSNHTRMVVSEN